MIKTTANMTTRRGAVTVEAILVIPMLFITTLAIGQFFIVALVHQAAAAAAADGAKVASLGGDVNAVGVRVDEVLDTVSLAIGAEATVVRETSAGSTSLGSYACSTPTTPILDPDEVRVTVCIDMTAAPLLNALSSFGIDLTGKTLRVSSQTFVE